MAPSREDFGHPYQPYDIQSQFMQNLYECLEHGNVGIFESPTGTGKSLSLICGSLTWLRDHDRHEVEQILESNADDGTDWLAAAERVNQQRALMREREDLEARLALLRDKEAAKKRQQHDHRSSKKSKLENGEPQVSFDDDEFVLDDYQDPSDSQGGTNGVSVLSSSTQALLNQLKPALSEREDDIETDRTKIIFCSRTHSQLTQFVHELRKVTPSNGVPIEAEDTLLAPAEAIKHIPLGSRKNLCINSKVSRLSSAAAINERCLDLQQSGLSKDARCQYLPSKNDRDRTDEFRDRAIATIQDIEDIAELGRVMKVCPYYASRRAIAPCEVLTLPYPLLLQKSAREALGVQIKNNVVIIDEAHNLMDAIADTLSVSLSLSQLNLATRQLTFYVQRFRNRLKGLNRAYITQIIRIMNSIADCVSAAVGGKQNEVAVTTADLMSGKGVDQIQPHKLLEYLVTSKLGHKVEGYAESKDQRSGVSQPKGTLMQVQSFIAVLMNPDAEGRFFVSRQDSELTVRYTLLDPREHFRDIVEDARAVILAGGTMSPMSDYADYLFSYLEPERLKTYSFGHVIPKEHLLIDIISSGPTGAEFEFTFGKRGSEPMIQELGRAIVQACRSVPDGIVVFFPSYDYLAHVVALWRRPHGERSIFQTLELTKVIFEETRAVSVDKLLQEYAAAIDTGKGGLMLSVVGGKLSEGINFSDRLGRAVIAVGLPFPNIQSGEWKAKIAHVEKVQLDQSRRNGKDEKESQSMAKAAGRDFYENACMRAVNQSIGRAIRHHNDYAAILLADKRFATDRIRNKLPGWIHTSMKSNGHEARRDWQTIENDLVRFFDQKR